MFTFMDIHDIKNSRILDVGCGYGQFIYHALKKEVKRISGIEVSENDLATARKYIRSNKFDSKVGSAIAIPYNESTFDTVVAWEVLEHIPYQTEPQFFKEVYRVLKVNGVFYLSTPYDHFMSKVFDPAYWVSGHRHYSKSKLIDLALKNGFLIEKMEVVGRYWTVLSLLNMYVSKWFLRRDRLFKPFFLEKENKEYGQEGFHNIFIKFRKKSL